MLGPSRAGLRGHEVEHLFEGATGCKESPKRSNGQKIMSAQAETTSTRSLTLGCEYAESALIRDLARYILLLRVIAVSLSTTPHIQTQAKRF